MATFKLTRTDHQELVFDGELLGESCSSRVEAEDGQRGYDLALYVDANNAFVVSIVYVSTCQQEQTVAQAEALDSPDDVEKMLLVYEPCEHVDRRMLHALPDEQRRRLRKKLYDAYDEQVSKILEILNSHCRQLQGRTDAKSEAATHRGILGFLGIK